MRTMTGLKYGAAKIPSGKIVVLGMEAENTLYCAGMTLFRIYQGHVSILGFQPTQGVYYTLYSPKWDSILTIKGHVSVNVKRACALQASFGAYNQKLAQLMCAEALDVADDAEADILAKRIAVDYPIVLIFHTISVNFGNLMCYYDNALTKKIESSDTPSILPGFKLLDSGTFDESAVSEKSMECPSDQILRSLFVRDSFRVVQITMQWDQTVKLITESVRSDSCKKKIVVCGAKGVGKSTFCRYLINQLLSEHPVVAFLDTDLGQPELTPPGLVSLHGLTTPLLGPGFTTMRMPLRSYFCGNNNPSNDPLYYLKAVKNLLQVYMKNWGSQQSIPLVINTDGWIKSMGHDLLCNIIEEVNPHHIVQLLAMTKNKLFDLPTEGKWRIHRLHPWEAMSPNLQTPRSSKEMRLYRYHSYFLSSMECSSVSRQGLQDLYLTSNKNRLNNELHEAYEQLVPYVVSLDDLLVSCTGSTVPEAQVLDSLNASLIGLCIQHSSRNDSHVPISNRFHAPCVGIGLVRAVDPVNRLLYIVNPLPLDTISRVNLIIRGNLALETFKEQQTNGKQSPFRVTGFLCDEGSGSTIMKSRHNIKRKREERGI
uniref:Uncharacterized protein AlNc14C2G339 n=1 Tax=Albugo laibachii Nc14 TaxID=890382 RepID=F0VZK1_9STRA|nr:conserved hypothetical protein [Albugo laibachii Nc14]|eukprot:CCA14231.1 conserved hypothetical protein [Albugo laibachii Nc14]